MSSIVLNNNTTVNLPYNKNQTFTLTIDIGQGFHITIARFVFKSSLQLKRNMSDLINAYLDVLNMVMPKGGYKNYDVYQSNDVQIWGKNSLKFDSNDNKYSLENIIIKEYHTKIAQMNIFEMGEIMQPFQSIVHTNVKGDFSKKDGIFSTIPIKIDLTKIKII